MKRESAKRAALPFLLPRLKTIFRTFFKLITLVI